MIQVQTRLSLADNSGAKELMCIRVLGGTRKRYAKVGDIIVCSVKRAVPHAPIKKGTIVKAVVVRTKQSIKRKDGMKVRFDVNSAVIVDDNKNPKGSRVFGPVARELRDGGFLKIISLADKVV